MRGPNEQELSGLWKALNAAEATPVGGDFSEQSKEDIQAAIAWLERESRRSIELAARKARRRRDLYLNLQKTGKED